MSSHGSCCSESDISTSSGSVYLDADASFQRYRRRRIRRESITSVSTNPEEEAYVMVLQNRTALYDDIKNMASIKDICDVTFLVGDEREAVWGVREIISTRNSLLSQLVSSFENNSKADKRTKKSRLQKRISKLNKLNYFCSTRRKCSNRDDVTKKLIIPMDTFDQESFQRFISYIHCGTLTVDASTVIGLLNAAYMFNLPEVKEACWSFALGCVVRADNLHDLFSSARRYAGHRMTYELIKMMSKIANDNPAMFSHSRTLSDLVSEVFRQQDLDVDVNAYAKSG